MNISSLIDAELIILNDMFTISHLKRDALNRLVGLISSNPDADFSNLTQLKIVNTIIPLLMNNNRLLRLEILNFFESCWMNYESKSLNATDTILEIITVLPPLISASDLEIAQNTIALCNMFLKNNHPDVKCRFLHCLMSPIVDLLKSPLLQGSTLEALVSLMRTISSMELFDVKIITSHLVTNTISNVHIDCIHSGAYPNIARCVAELIINVNSISNTKRDEYIEEFYQTALIKHTTDCSSYQYLSIMILGDIGRTIDMSQRKDVLESITNVFSCGNEILKSPLANSLFKMALCRLDIFVPYILDQIQQYTHYQDFLLHSLCKIILAVGCSDELKYSDISDHVDIIWNILMVNSNSPKEVIRNIVLKCIGQLALMDPAKVRPKLREIVNHNTKPAITDVVSVVYLNSPLDLQLLAHHVKACLYNPEQFPGLMLNNINPRACGLIYSSGKMVVTGTTSVGSSQIAARKITEIVQSVCQKFGEEVGNNVEYTNFQVVNISGYADMGYSVDLRQLCDAHPLYASLDLEICPALVYRLLEPETTFSVFANGQIVSTGSTSEQFMFEAFSKFEPILRLYKK